MDLNSFFLLFPSIFMLHEFEEMLLFPYFMGRNQQLQRRFLAGGVYTVQIQRRRLSGIHTPVDCAGLEYVF
nr:hypothetical protein [Veillonella denticariosi]